MGYLLPSPVLFRAQRRVTLTATRLSFLPSRAGRDADRDFGVPVWMRSSVETMTMGELHAGAGIGTRSTFS